MQGARRSKFRTLRVKDALQPVLEEILESDGLILSMPIFFGDVPGTVRSFLERLWFPGYTYSKDGSVACTKKVPSLLVHTMNSQAEYYTRLFAQLEGTFKAILGPSSHFAVPDTLQFSDYAMHASEVFDAEAKIKRHDEIFPKEGLKAHELGAALVKGE